MQKDFEIIKNIAQAASNITYDGATDENYEPHQIGLRREEGNPILDSRNIDGFNVRMSGNHLIVSYSVETKLSEVYATKIEQEMEKRFLSMGRDDAANPMNITRKET
jgi:hypothetical protein